MCVSKDNWDIKLIDFGLAQELVSGVRMKALKGTPEFMGMFTPECSSQDFLSLFIIEKIFLFILIVK